MTTSIGEALVQYLEASGVEVIFGIPGVHTIELYRGLAQSGIRHITARHEQGIGFMADGYARVSGRPGVCFVITGPGMTNILTPMAQARADSVPMLVVSGVNERASLGLGLGHLHELPNQHALCAQVAVTSTQVSQQEALLPALDQAFEDFSDKRPGPVHIQIPIDVMGLGFELLTDQIHIAGHSTESAIPSVESAAKQLAQSNKVVILAGGGTRHAEASLTQLAEYLSAPVVLTSNARGLMHQHPLCVPASPSLQAVRALIAEADCVLALGTEMGSTDYDMYRNNEFPPLKALIRVDICPQQLAKHPADIGLQGDTKLVLESLLRSLQALSPTSPVSFNKTQSHQRAEQTRTAAFAELPEAYQEHIQLLNLMRDTYPNAILVGDSTQLVYAGSMYYDHDCAGGWFHAATGYGALGYGIPAAIGAALAAPERQVICITGDGGAQFSFAELMVAVQEQLPIIFIVWNNQGYLEIENAMLEVDIVAVGCDPIPPSFEYLAKACSMPYLDCSAAVDSLEVALLEGKKMIEASARKQPIMIEISV